MKGLLRNNFYAAVENMKLMLFVLFLFGILLLITGSPALLGIFPLLAPPVLGLLAFSSLRKETASNWYKYKLSFPLPRKKIVESQYLCHILWSLAGMCITAIFLALTLLIHGNPYFYYGLRDALTLILGGGILALLIGVLSYPLYYLLGTEKMEFILILSILFSIGVVLGLSLLINFLMGDGGVSDFQYYVSLLFLLAVTGTAFLLSFFFSCSIFTKKEY